jgi:hypothetical protein
MLHTVAETSSFLRSAKECGLTLEEVDTIKLMVAADPQSGDALEGTGGFRKLRVAGRGKGKSGGYRVVTFYSGAAIPVFLIRVFSKGMKENLSAAERNALKSLSKEIIAGYGKRIVRLTRTR